MRWGRGNIPDRGTACAHVEDGRKEGSLKELKKTSAVGTERRGDEKRGGQRPERSYGEKYGLGLLKGV